MATPVQFPWASLAALATLAKLQAGVLVFGSHGLIQTRYPLLMGGRLAEVACVYVDNNVGAQTYQVDTCKTDLIAVSQSLREDVIQGY